MIFRRLSPLVLCSMAWSCGGGSSTPTAPGQVDAASAPHGFRGEAVSAIDGRPFKGVTVKIGSQTAQSDDNGSFDVRNLSEGAATLVLSGSAVVERQRTVTIPAGDPSRETLIPSSFDLTAFDQMFRGSGQLERWTSAPRLVVLGRIMSFEKTTTDRFLATSERLSQSEIDELIAHLTEGLGLLTGNTFTRFASVDVETPSSGSRVSTLRTGRIVVGLYRGVQAMSSTIGYGRWETNAQHEVTGGSMYLDRGFDRSSQSNRLVRIHELGHALGYQHVTARTSIMNPAIGPQPTDFDRQGAVIAFQRLPGNLSPDIDSAGTARSSLAPGDSPRRVWSPPTICH